MLKTFTACNNGCQLQMVKCLHISVIHKYSIIKTELKLKHK